MFYKRLKPTNFAICGFVLSMSLTALGETQAQKGAKSFLRMASLEKLTVGPFDNFQGVLTPNGKSLLLTRSANMATHIQVVDMTSVASRGSSKSLVGDTFDTRDPVPSPGGIRVAFTSFERNARGQICIATLEDTRRDCLATGKNGARQPQWLSDDVVAYLESSDDGETENLVSLNVLTREKTSFFSDNILTFSFHPNNKHVVYVAAPKKNGGIPVMRWRDVSPLGEARDLRFEIPGMASFPRFDLTGSYLYFSQFFNDTNSDGVIDGDDNAVPFRVEWKKAREVALSLIPEQLISAEYNCSYPSLSSAAMLVTCNFEDSLDIYRMPLAGVVPANWTEDQILSAHAAARTPSERVLLLNTLRFRFPAKYDNAQTVERLLANHVVSKEYDAGVYYASALAARNSALSPSLNTLSAFLEAHNFARRENTANPSPTLLGRIETLRERVTARPVNEFSELALVAFDWLINRRDAAFARWKSINPDAYKLPMSVHLYGELGSRMLRATSASPDALFQLEKNMATHGALSDEAQVSHALEAMRLFAIQHPTPQRRIEALKQIASQAPSGSILAAFFEAESLAMQLVLTENAKEQGTLSKQIAKAIYASSRRPFLKRGLNVRLLVQFSAFHKEQAVDLIASGWVSEAKKADAEYVYAREQYLMTRLDKAYAYMSKDNLAFAGDVFYGAMRVVDDAEAHVGFLDARARGGRAAEVDKTYEDLVKTGFVAENAKLALAWRNLQKSDTSAIEKSIEELVQVIEAEGYNPAVAWYLIGYAHHRVTLASRHKLEFNRDSMERAHHAYMVALDLSRGNKRLLAPIFSNLGQLHSIAHNYGQAAAFYAKRLALPFALPQDRIATLWLAAKFSFAGNNAPQALSYMEEALKNVSSTEFAKHRSAFLERAAFYAVDASLWEKAAQYYGEYFAVASSGRGDFERNNLKARTNYAWSLMKLGQNSRANVAARAVLSSYKAIPNSDAKENELVPFRADRYAAQAYSILAQLEQDPIKAVNYRKERLAILESWGADLKGYSLDKNSWRSFVVREQQQLALLKTLAGVANPMEGWEQAIASLQKHYTMKDDATDPAYFYVLLNALVVATDRKAPVSAALREKFDVVVPEYLTRMSEVSSGDKGMIVRWMRLSLLWNAYQTQAGRMSVTQEGQARNFILRSSLAREILDTDPSLFALLPGRARITEMPDQTTSSERKSFQ